VSNFTTRAANASVLDFARLHVGWADKLARTLGVPSCRPHQRCGTATTAAQARARAGPQDPSPAPSQLDLSRAAQKAVPLAQQEKSTWTRR
jgi:hypothetical protein